MKRQPLTPEELNKAAERLPSPRYRYGTFVTWVLLLTNETCGECGRYKPSKEFFLWFIYAGLDWRMSCETCTRTVVRRYEEAWEEAHILQQERLLQEREEENRRIEHVKKRNLYNRLFGAK